MVLTDKDLENIQELISVALREEVPEIVKKELKRELSYLPTKDDFFSRMDKLSAELKNMRETYELAAPKISDHEQRISLLEDIHPSGTHASL